MPKFFNTIEAQVGNFTIQNSADNKDIIFKSDNGSGGLTEYFRLDGSSEINIFSKDTFFIDNVDLKVGSSGDLILVHDSSNSFINNITGDLTIKNSADNKDIILQSDNGSGGVIEYLRLDGSDERLTVNAPNGMLFFDSIKAKFGTGSDLDLYHDGTSSYIRNATGNLNIQQNADDADISFQCDDGSGSLTEYFRVDGGEGRIVHSVNSRYIDNAQIMVGTGADLQILHDGNNSFIQNSTGQLQIIQNTTDEDIIFLADGGSGSAVEYMRLDGSQTTIRMKRQVKWDDNIKATFGDGDDLEIQHNGTHSFITNATGDLTIANYADDRSIYFQSDDGGGGSANYIQIDGANVRTLFSINAEFSDNVKAKFGSSDDLEIYHDGSHSYIQDSGTGVLKILSSGVTFQNAGGSSNLLILDSSGNATFAGAINLDSNHINIDGNGAVIFDNTNNNNAWYIRNGGTNSATLQFGLGTPGSNIKHTFDGSGNVTFAGTISASNLSGTNTGDQDLSSLAPKASPTFTGTPAAPTASAGTNTTQLATTAFVSTAVSNLVDSAPGTLNTLNELAAALGDDASFSTTVTDSIAGKVSKSGDTMTGNLHIEAGSPVINLKDTTDDDDQQINFKNNSGTVEYAIRTQDFTSGGGGDGFYIGSKSSDKLVLATNNTAALTIDTSQTATFVGHIELADGKYVYFGGADDLGIVHSGTDSLIVNETGHLKIRNKANDKDIIFESDDGSGGVTDYLIIDGSATIITAHKNLRFDDSIQLQLGVASDLRIFHDGTDSKIHNDTGHLVVEIDADDKDFSIFADDGSGGLAEYFRVDGSLTLNRFLKSTLYNDNVRALFGADSDLQLYHSGSSAIMYNSTGNITFTNYADDQDIIFQSDDGSGGVATYFFLDGSLNITRFSESVRFEANVNYTDSVEARFGNSNDLTISHNATNSIIDNITGNLIIQNQTNDADIQFKCDDGSGGLTEYFRLDGSIAENTFSRTTKVIDNFFIGAGNSTDLYLTHDGTNSSIINNTGNLTIQNNTDDGDIIFRSDDGSGGTAEYLKISGSAESIITSKSNFFGDNVKAIFGAGSDLQIYHDGSNSYIDETGTGSLYIKSAGAIRLQSDTGENMIYAVNDGAVNLYHNNVKKFETKSTGVAINGHDIISDSGRLTISGQLGVTSIIANRSIPCIVTTGWGDDVSTTSNRIIPLGNSTTDTTISSADGFHFVVMPYAGNVKKIVMKNVAGSLSSSFTTELKLYKNGANVTSSGELTASSSAITWEPSSSNTFSANDEISLVYQKSATGKYWREVSLTMVLEFTGQDI